MFQLYESVVLEENDEYWMPDDLPIRATIVRVTEKSCWLKCPEAPAYEKVYFDRRDGECYSMRQLRPSIRHITQEDHAAWEAAGK